MATLRSRLKYKVATILLALLMAYMLFCAVMCAIAAAKQGGYVYRIMMFSIIATYGGKRASIVALSVTLTAGGSVLLLQYSCI